MLISLDKAIDSFNNFLKNKYKISQNTCVYNYLSIEILELIGFSSPTENQIAIFEKWLRQLN